MAGYDSVAANVEAGLELGALDRGAATVAEAVDGARVVFCAAPVEALPGLVAEALAATDEHAVVTDVGSTKRELIASLPDDESSSRFIGGHPLAGAETAGVENARAELLEGARWYLTPTERSSGLALRPPAEHALRPRRPAAGDQRRDPRPGDGTVSHLPHVLANVLVSEAAEALSEVSERLPEVGTSFRDTTRVAGANPAIWAGIFASNREAVADGLDSIADAPARRPRS